MVSPGGLFLMFRRLLSIVLLLAGAGFSPAQLSSSLTTYVSQSGTPAAIPNFVNPAAGCNWQGVGGQVFNQSGQPVSGMILNIYGVLEGKPVSAFVVSGSSVQFGPGGFDLKLSDHPIASFPMMIRVYDVAGQPQSGEILFRTYDTCSQNLVVVNLVQTTFTWFLYLPQISR